MRRLWEILLAAGVAVIVSAFAVSFLLFPDHTDVRNLSGQTVTCVVLRLQGHQTDWTVIRKVASLKAGESISIRHSHKNTKAVVEFTISGKKVRYEEGYIDLWTGEGWVFGIQPDGTVTSGYADPAIHRHYFRIFGCF
jgi:hypothetical protein